MRSKGRGRRLQSFIDKYGDEEGRKLYKRLKQEAAHKSNIVQQKKRLGII